MPHQMPHAEMRERAEREVVWASPDPAGDLARDVLALLAEVERLHEALAAHHKIDEQAECYICAALSEKGAKA